MPYYKSYKSSSARKYRRQGRRRFKKRILYKAVKGGIKALKYLNPEKKFLDQEYNNAAIPQSGIFKNLPETTRGNSASNRIGEQVKLISVYIRYFLKIHPTVSQTYCRMMLLEDNQANGAAATLTDILQSPTTPLNMVSPLNLGNKFRFKILWEQCVTLDTNSSDSSKCGKYYMPLQKLIRYNGNAGDVTDLSSSNLIFVIFSDQPPASEPTFLAKIRTRFVDN